MIPTLGHMSLVPHFQALQTFLAKIYHNLLRTCSLPTSTAPNLKVIGKGLRVFDSDGHNYVIVRNFCPSILRYKATPQTHKSITITIRKVAPSCVILPNNRKQRKKVMHWI